MHTMTVGDWLKNNRNTFPEGESILFLSFVLHREKSFILAHPEYLLTEEEEKELDSYQVRRNNHEPFAYITGEKEFFGLHFFITQATLIPRPETEILVEQVLDKIKDQGSKIKDGETISLIDIGTGSGCIPISIAKTIQNQYPNIFPFVNFLATDISEAALAVAEKNAKHHDLKKIISFQKSNLLATIPQSYFQTPILIITANLPYLSREIWESSPPDVRLYEPQSALQGDTDDGTTLIITLLKQYVAKKIRMQSYFFILEISPEQAELLLYRGKELFPQGVVELIEDLSGKNRFLVIRNL